MGRFGLIRKYPGIAKMRRSLRQSLSGALSDGRWCRKYDRDTFDGIAENGRGLCWKLKASVTGLARTSVVPRLPSDHVDSTNLTRLPNSYWVCETTPFFA